MGSSAPCYLPVALSLDKFLISPSILGAGFPDVSVSCGSQDNTRGFLPLGGKCSGPEKVSEGGLGTWPASWTPFGFGGTALWTQDWPLKELVARAWGPNVAPQW